MPTKQEIIHQAACGEVICEVGQINKETARALDKLVKGGHLKKWRGRWYPIAGCQFGIGPLKTCWALPSTKEFIDGIDASEQRAA